MSQADDGGENNEPAKKIRDNVSPELKPNNVQHRNLAPRGMMGGSLPVPPPNSELEPLQKNREAGRPQDVQAHDIAPELDPAKHLPIALETGDKEVDAFTAKTHRLVNEEEFQRLQKQAIKDRLTSEREQNRGRNR